MKKILIFLIILFLPLAGFGQNNNHLVKKFNLPSEYKKYLKNESFFDLLQKSIDYKKANREEEFRFKGFSNWQKQECEFEETIYSYEKNEFGENSRTGVTVITHNFTNQRLKYKDITHWYISEITASMEVYFHKDGKVKIIDNWRDRIYYFLSPRGDILPRPDQFPIDSISNFKLQVSKAQLLKIRKKILQLEKGYDFNKPLEDFSIKDWKRYNKIRDYLRKTLKTPIDYYYRGMDVDELDLISEQGDIVPLVLHFYDVETKSRNQ